MKKIIFYCTLLFSSTIALAITILAYSAESKYSDLISVVLLFFIIEFLVSLFFSIKEVCKKDKN